MGEEENAAAQLAALRERGNADAVARGEALLGSEFSAEAAPAPHDVAAPDGTVDGGHAVDESAQETAPASAEDAGDADVDPAATPPDHDATPEEDGDASLELDLDMDDADLSLEDEEPAEAGTAEEPASDREATSEPASNRIEEDIAGADDDEDDALSLDDGDDDLDLTDALMGGGADGESSDDNGDGLLIAGSETGMVPIDEASVVEKGALWAGTSSSWAATTAPDRCPRCFGPRSSTLSTLPTSPT